MTGKGHVCEINLWVEPAQGIRGGNKAIIAARMHLIEGVGQVDGVQYLNDRRAGIMAQRANRRIIQKHIWPGRLAPKVHAGRIYLNLKQVWVGRADEFPEGVRATYTGHIAAVGSAPRAAKRHLR